MSIVTQEQGATKIGGSIAAPASKSSMQRAITCASLAQGLSKLHNPSFCADSRAVLALVQELGCTVHESDTCVTISGSMLELHKKNSAAELNLTTGESGLAMRMLSPVLAMLARPLILHAQGSLQKRPMTMLEAPLKEFGARISTNNGFAPLQLCGPLQGGALSLDASESSQFLTGLLIALPLASTDSVLKVHNPVSKGYLDLTLDTMRAFGVVAERNEQFTQFTIAGRQEYKAREFTIEGDWSGAAFLLVAGAIGIKARALCVSGLQFDSSQPDRKIMEALASCGAQLTQHVDCVTFTENKKLHAFNFDASDCPDLFPPLVALASYCVGTSKIKGVSRLKNKESDRALALSSEFAKLGIQITIDSAQDELHIRGGEVKGGSVHSHHDHRIAMACAIAALGASAPVYIEEAGAVTKSWPEFFSDLAQISVK